MLTPRNQAPKLLQDAEKVIGELLPAEVIDQESYKEYLRINKNPILNERMHVELTSGRKFSLGTAIRHIESYMEEDSIPEQERNGIRNQKKLWNTINCKRNAYIRKAYGTTVDKEGRYRRKGDKFVNVQKEMVELFGRMFTAKEVHEIVVQQFEIPCSLQSIINFRELNIAEINAKIEEHKHTYSDIRLGHKRSRLEELTWLYASRKRIYERTKKGEDHKLLLATLEQLRKEIEGDSLRIDGLANNNVELTIQQHIHQELFVNFPLKEIILSRVAARANITPENLLTEINKSYYHGVLHANPDEQVQNPAFPSTQTYDFDNIRRIQWQAAAKPKAAVTVISTEKVNVAATVKEALLAKLKNKSDHINHQREKLTGKYIDKANEVDLDD